MIGYFSHCGVTVTWREAVRPSLRLDIAPLELDDLKHDGGDDRDE
jgi:hypothetical protein